MATVVVARFYARHPAAILATGAVLLAIIAAGVSVGDPSAAGSVWTACYVFLGLAVLLQVIWLLLFHRF